MNRLLKFTLGLVLLAFMLPGGVVVLAQSGTVDNVSLNYIEAESDETTGAVTIKAYVSAVDDQGQPVTGLAAENFSVIEDGKPMAVESVTVADDPISVILVMDTSGSMAKIGENGLPAIETAKQAAVAFIEGLNEGDEAAAFSFNDDVTLESDLTHDHNAVINSINMLSYKDFGGTCLYDAAIEAVQKSAEVLQGRRAIIVLTDGVDEASQEEGACSLYTLTDVVAEANERTSKVPIFAIGFGNVDERELLRMARLTGGQGFIGENVADLSALFNTISRQLNSQYLVSYQTQAASGEHSVVVKVTQNDLTETDERPVFVPAVQAQPTPTAEATSAPIAPLTVAITDATKDKPEPGMLEVLINIDPIDQVIQSELFIGGKSITVLQEPPFDVFNLQMSELPPGENTMRVEVTAQDGAIASNERDITITVPPTPLPTAIPTATPGPLEQLIPVPVTDPIFILLVVAACLIALLILGIVGYLLFGRKKQQSDLPLAGTYGGQQGEQNDPAPVDVFVTHDEIEDAPVYGGMDPYATIDEIIINAQLEVVESEQTPAGQTFPIRKPEVTIGRDAGAVTNDINIPDPTVSRQHAKIVYDGVNYKIFNNSRNGVFVNDKMISDDGEILPEEAEVKLGRKTRLKFTIGSSEPEDDPFRTQDDLDDPDETLYNYNQ